MVVPYDSPDLVRTLIRVPNQVDRQSDASILNLGVVSSLAAGENVSSNLPSCLLSPSQKKTSLNDTKSEGLSTSTKHFRDYKKAVKAGILPPTTISSSSSSSLPAAAAQILRAIARVNKIGSISISIANYNQIVSANPEIASHLKTFNGTTSYILVRLDRPALSKKI